MSEIRRNSNGVVLVDAGDLLFKKSQGLLSENDSKMFADKALLIVQSFGLMGYDAIGVGDDDFNLGKEFLVEISKKATFPFLSSNLVDEESGRLLFQSHLVKEVNGLRVGIFSLISPGLFAPQGDPRKKGLIFRDLLETARSVLAELQPKTDLIILLSHLGFAKESELARAVPGINLIVGSHTGINFVYPSIVNHAVILQTAAKGMTAGKLDLSLYNRDLSVYNTATRRSTENNLNSLNALLKSERGTEAERAQWTKAKQAAEQNLKQFQGKNELTNAILPLGEQIKNHPEIAAMVESFRSKYPEAGKPDGSR